MFNVRVWLDSGVAKPAAASSDRAISVEKRGIEVSLGRIAGTGQVTDSHRAVKEVRSARRYVVLLKAQMNEHTDESQQPKHRAQTTQQHDAEAPEKYER